MDEQSSIRVLLVDDHFVVRMGLATLINSQDDMTVVSEGANGKQAIDLFREHNPDVTLMDLRMPEMNGVEAIIAIRREYPECRIIVLTTYDGDEDIYRAFQAGARAYLLKDMHRDELLEAIRAVHRGQRFIPPAVANSLAERMPRSELTGRELEVLKLIVKGMSNREIAGALEIAEGTVKIHVNNILSKLGVGDRTKAATTAIQRGIVHLE
ncbi:MAG TPA: response regulator transcription factor [Blastocatellia bacterium]|jgi:two-component system NarL family response regulator|nr:response regulator transcription factor [Blastocatellia bacterium]